MPRFTLREMLVSVTAVAIGLAVVVFLLDSGQILPPRFRMFLWLAAGALMGGALLTPLRRPLLGALIGLALQVLLLHFFFGRQLFPPEQAT